MKYYINRPEHVCIMLTFQEVLMNISEGFCNWNETTMAALFFLKRLLTCSGLLCFWRLIPIKGSILFFFNQINVFYIKNRLRLSSLSVLVYSIHLKRLLGLSQNMVTRMIQDSSVMKKKIKKQAIWYSQTIYYIKC